MMGMSTTAFAAGEKVLTVGNGTEEAQASVSITKDFEMAEGLGVPNVTFYFTATKVTQDAPDATSSSIHM